MVLCARFFSFYDVINGLAGDGGLFLFWRCRVRLLFFGRLFALSLPAELCVLGNVYAYETKKK